MSSKILCEIKVENSSPGWHHFGSAIRDVHRAETMIEKLNVALEAWPVKNVKRTNSY